MCYGAMQMKLQNGSSEVSVSSKIGLICEILPIFVFEEKYDMICSVQKYM